MDISFPIRIVTGDQVNRPTVQAQLYNLDNDEFLNFQFMPRDASSTDVNWSEEGWRGSDRTHRQFLGVSQASVEISADFWVDPGAPNISCSTDPPVNYTDTAGNSLVSIESLVVVLNSWWLNISETEGRPALLRFIRPEGSLDGIVTRFGYTPQERFPDGTIRRVTINIGFRQWRRIA